MIIGPPPKFHGTRDILEILIETELLERGSGELPPCPIRKGDSR